ncbi:HAMP domain-containing sensor histidine kinase [Bacillus sp. FJAT-27251]|uniref:sensor histidine kinase n=1 Tax=Bacillus sp. FJAT-27251 TaxID=1684142 RepID=UPI0006A7D789|nr:HAMP domain-containing sensor histidine kinase [Bacillus sp. FJAT-27251]
MRWTIRKKFTVSFLILFTVAAILFTSFLSNFIEEQALATIENDVLKLQHTTREYLKQFQELHPGETAIFSVHGQPLSRTLSELYGQSVALYTPEGHFITEAVPVDSTLLMSQKKHEPNVDHTSSTELRNAFDNKASYTIAHLDGGSIVRFAYPVYLQDEFYGVVRFTADYTNLFSHNEQLIQHFRFLAIILFFGVFCIALWLTQQIIKPLKTLTEATKRVANRTFNAVRMKPSTDEVGELAKHFTAMQDEINRYVSKIEEEKEKVLQLEKERTRLFQNVTHELKTPLTAISGYAQLIGEEDFDDKLFLQKAAAKIYSESTRLNTMINELLEFSKSQSTIRKPQHFPITPLVKSVVEELQFTSGQEIRFKGVPLYVKGVPEELERVLVNVIGNALKHGQQPVTVTVDQSIVVTNRCEEIPPGILQHLFEPFVHRQHKQSHGLGLFIAKQVTELNGGTLSFTYENQVVSVEIILATTRQHSGES